MRRFPNTSVPVAGRVVAFLAACCLAFWGIGPGHAQEIEPEDTGQEESLADRAADVRDAINENLVTPLRDEEEAEPQPIPEQEREEVAAEEEEETEEPWYRRFESATEYAQTIPEYVPVLRGKDWIHFGRVEGEYAYFSGGILEDDSGFNFRSLRGGIIRQFSETRTVKLELDLTDGDSNWVDLWGRFKTRFGVFTLGNQRVAQTLVNQTSRLSRTFMEVPLPADAFGLGRRLGVGWDIHRWKLGAHLTAFGKDLNDNIGKFGYGARVYVNPAKTRFGMFHIGASAVREEMDRDAQFRAYPETRVTDVRLVDTGRFTDVDDQSIFGLEIAAAKDSYSFRSEYFVAEWTRSVGADPRFHGYYLQANWVITGEAFQYAQGKFLRIRPQSPRGAWEIAARYSTINLNDLDVLGGEETNTSLALNWYGPGNQLRVQSSVIHVDTDENAGDQSTTIFQVRVQIHW
jgi:phosphate-selective porin OprO/OprP